MNSSRRLDRCRREYPTTRGQCCLVSLAFSDILEITGHDVLREKAEWKTPVVPTW